MKNYFYFILSRLPRPRPVTFLLSYLGQILNFFCTYLSPFQRNTRVERTLAMLWLSARLAAALGSRQCWHHLMHPGIFTEMAALCLCPSLKWKWEFTTAWGKASSAVWSESSLQKTVSNVDPIQRFLSLLIADIQYVIYRQSSLEPDEPPSNIRARAVSASEIEVHWKPIPPGSSSGKILAYEVWKTHFL